MLAGLVDGLVFAVLLSPLVALTWIRRRRDPSGAATTILDVAGTTVEAACRIWAVAELGQTPRQRALGIRLADRRTGAIPTPSQLLVRWAVTKPGEALIRLLPPVPDKARQATRTAAALRPEIAQLRQQFEGDRQGLNAALLALYRDSGVNPMDSCLPVLVRVLPGLLYECVVHGFALRGPLHRACTTGQRGRFSSSPMPGSDPAPATATARVGRAPLPPDRGPCAR